MVKIGTKNFFIKPFRNKFFVLLLGTHLASIFILDKLFGKSHFLAPDEQGYLQVAKDVYGANYDYIQWGWPWRTPVWFLKIIYFPFKLMVDFGLADLIAFRINSLIFTLLSAYLVLCVIQATSVSLQPSFLRKISLLTFFAPTFFLWGTLGLRESFLYFSFSLIGSGMLLIENKGILAGFLLLVVGCVFLAYTKDYMYLIFLVSIALVSMIRIVQRRTSAIAVICTLAVILAPIIITPAITIGLKDQVKQIVFGEAALRANLSGNSTGGEFGAWSTERGLVEACEKNSQVSSILEFIKPSKKIGVSESCAGLADLQEIETLNSVPSQPKEDLKPVPSQPKGDLKPVPSQPKEDLKLLTGAEAEWQSSRAARLSLEPAHLREPNNVVKQFFKIIILPTPVIDNGSSIMNLISWESWIWISLILFPFIFISLDLILRKRISNLRLWASIMLFGILFSSALTEINVGTMIRHRSLVLIPSLFIILTTDFSKYNLVDVRKSVARFKRRGN